MAQNQPFEMPPQLRELAEKNIEQARAAYAHFMDAMTKAAGAWSNASSNASASGFKDVQDLAIRFAKENAEAGFKLASDLANAKDVQSLLALQSRFAQTQVIAYGHQAQELGRLIAEAVQNMKPTG
jgi:phasin